MAQSGKQSSFLLDHRVHDEEVEDTGQTSQARLVASNMVLMGLWRRHYFRKSRHQMPLAFGWIATFGRLHLPEPFHIPLSSQNQATRWSCRAARCELSSFSSLNREAARLVLAGQKLVCHPLV